MTTGELATGILQITHQGAWSHDVWADAKRDIEAHLFSHTENVYIMIDLLGTTTIHKDAFYELVTSDYYTHPRVGMAVLVGRRVHLQMARDIVHQERDEQIQLRLMLNRDDAFRALLDKQVMDRISSTQRHGG